MLSLTINSDENCTSAFQADFSDRARRNVCDIDEVIPGSLFIGSIRGIANTAHLHAKGITHIINASQRRCALDSDPSFQHLFLDVADSAQCELFRDIPRCISFIEDASRSGGVTAVYCVKGLSRSVAVVCGYLMWKHRWTWEDALAFVQQSRPEAAPNYGFCLQLAALGRSGFDVSATVRHLSDPVAAPPVGEGEADEVAVSPHGGRCGSQRPSSDALEALSHDLGNKFGVKATTG